MYHLATIFPGLQGRRIPVTRDQLMLLMAAIFQVADGVQIGAEITAPGSPQNVVDTAVTNGTNHFYAVFCRNGTTWNDTAVQGANADTGLPIDIVGDLTASDGDDTAVTIDYTMPAGATACKVQRTQGAAPQNDTDGVQLDDAEQIGGGAQRLTDSGLTNGDTYHVQLGTYGVDHDGYGPSYNWCNYYTSLSFVLSVSAGGGTCGDGVIACDGSEDCDDPDMGACMYGCRDCTCLPPPVPMLPAAGLVGLGVLLVTGGALVFGRRRK